MKKTKDMGLHPGITTNTVARILVKNDIGFMYIEWMNEEKIATHEIFSSFLKVSPGNDKSETNK